MKRGKSCSTVELCAFLIFSGSEILFNSLTTGRVDTSENNKTTSAAGVSLISNDNRWWIIGEIGCCFELELTVICDLIFDVYGIWIEKREKNYWHVFDYQLNIFTQKNDQPT